jgi:hypothetical protein
MNWKQLKQLNQLITTGETSAELLETPLGRRLYDMEYIITPHRKVLQKTPLFDSFDYGSYVEEFNSFQTLLTKYDLLDTNFNKDELVALLKIDLDREVIIVSNKSQKEISSKYFDSSKYLKKESKLSKAITKILDTIDLNVTEHDQQYLYVLHCISKSPKAIILCENINQLRKQRLNDVELWFAGGRNTAKLKYIPEPVLPFYYLCDWDNRGIEIYQDIKKNIFPSIELLLPQEPIKKDAIIREWKINIDYQLFSREAKNLLQFLMPNHWIEEESINHTLLTR